MGTKHRVNRPLQISEENRRDGIGGIDFFRAESKPTPAVAKGGKRKAGDVSEINRSMCTPANPAPQRGPPNLNVFQGRRAQKVKI